MRTLILPLIAVIATVHAQQTAFEVVSIRRNPTVEGGGNVVQGRRYWVRNQTVMGVVIGAYLLPAERIIGLPDWALTERYEINAQAEKEFANGELPVLLRGLLRDRFGFAAQMETRELPAYNLVLARTDGTFGPRLRRADVDCRDAASVAKARASGRESPICGGQSTQKTVRLRGLYLEALARALAAPAGRPVVNRTALVGAFDIDLDWSTVDSPDGVAIFTAVQEQLGLKLESTRASFDVLVVERVQRPTEN